MREILAAVLVSVLVACGGGSGDGDDGGPSTTPQCSDGIDNDGDGSVDFPDDPGCTNDNDDTEDSFPSPQCNDGRDNDGDGLADYPADPGCIAPQQDDETDDCPDGPNCPECGNHKDDDDNGSMDYPDDPGCTSASDTSERVNNPVACGAGLTIEQIPTTNTVDGKLDGMSTSQVMSPCGGGNGGAAVAYQMFLSKPRVVVVSTEDANTEADTVIDIRSTECAQTSSELACNDDAPGSETGASKVTASLPAGNYYIIVSARDTAAGNAFTMTVKTYAGEGTMCSGDMECGPGLVCRMPQGASAKSCTQPMCKDGVDDDGDNKNDYPDDPGCTSPDDNDESDSCPGVGPNCPECGDGVDNDGDTKIDYGMDTTCLAAGDSSEACVTTDGVTLITMPTTTGTTDGTNNDVHPSCASSSSHTAPDRTFRLDLPALDTLDINLDTSWDSVAALYNATCGGTALSCVDIDPEITRTNVAAGAYFYVVDGYFDDSGVYDIHVSGTIKNGGDCEAPLAQSGALTCHLGYACKGTAGARTCQPATCSDGVDNDSDGKIDYPFDPGCDSPADDTEANPATPPVCSDGMDNDSDSTMDWPNDYGCSSAAGTSEAFCPAEVDPTALITSSATMGTTVGKTDNFPSASCAFSSNAMGKDVTYALSLPVPVQSLTLDTHGAGFDTILIVKDVQCMTEVGCNDDTVTDTQSSLTLTSLSAGNYAVTVDGYNGATGAFTLTAKGTVAPMTACSSPLFTGASPLLSCPTGTTCTGSPLKCQ